MKIPFDQIPEEVIDGFKGGEGKYGNRIFSDDQVRIVRGRLTPGSHIGFHVHEGDSECMYFISGTGKVLYDGGYVPLGPGVTHYCPEHHGHSLCNDGEEDLCFFAVIAKHHV